MRSNYSRGGNRGNNRGGQGRGGYQGDRQQRDGDRPQTSGGGYNNYNNMNNNHDGQVERDEYARKP